MGGNVVMSYAGVRPQRVRRLVNLEGFGMPATQPQQAPQRLAQWLDELKTPERAARLRRLDAVAARLRQRPAADARQGRLAGAALGRAGGADGRWQILGDPAHKRVNPVLYHVDEVLETWKLHHRPVLWVEGDLRPTPPSGGATAIRAANSTRLAVVPQVHTRRCWRPAATCCTTTSPRRWREPVLPGWRFLAPGCMRESRVCTQEPRPPWTSNTSTRSARCSPT
jgi:pimeloyl-ACP methyl ester carboxylesterase